jgi:hypothetical protein
MTEGPVVKDIDETPMCWGYADSDIAERWTGALPTREAAIHEALVELDDDIFWIQQGRHPDPSDFFPSAQELFELARERACDEVGEAAEEWPDVGLVAEGELDALLKAWMQKHLGRCAFWAPVGEPEEIVRADVEKGG